MSRQTRGAVATPPPHLDPLVRDGGNLEHNLDYFQILADAGAFRQGGQIFHKLPVGQPFRQVPLGQSPRQGARWVQQTKTFPVAMSAEEARKKTRATGDRWDYYEAGAKCKQCAEVGSGLISGWVLGGRKFQAEHAHVTDLDTAVYSYDEVDPPEMSDEDGAAIEAPLLVEA